MELKKPTTLEEQVILLEKKNIFTYKKAYNNALMISLSMVGVTIVLNIFLVKITLWLGIIKVATSQEIGFVLDFICELISLYIRMFICFCSL